MPREIAVLDKTKKVKDIRRALKERVKTNGIHLHYIPSQGIWQEVKRESARCYNGKGMCFKIGAKRIRMNKKKG